MATEQRQTTPRADSLTTPAAASPTRLPPITTLPAQPAKHDHLSPKEVLHGLASKFSPRPLTGAAALADARRAREDSREKDTEQTASQVSHNQAVLALNALMGRQETSKPTDAPTPAASANHHPDPGAPIPVRTAKDGAAADDSAAMQSDSQLVDEPESMEDGAENTDESPTGHSLTYPGPGLFETPIRNDHSQPGSGSYDSGQKSTKRHKCPHCATDFTRHHNLKSHLLTHSQEKPYVCQTCSARFRRLHDLKRHAKLHTGERPHICPKCGRKFARGDALARHNKGPGGCANRKSSFGGEDDGEGDDTMDGLEYDDERGDDSEMLDDHARRVSEPMARKRPLPDASPDEHPHQRHSLTYPPPLSRVSVSAPMGPPSTLISPTNKSFAESHSAPPQPDHQLASPYYTQPHASAGYPITESPRPISPRDPHRLSVGDPQGLRNSSPNTSTAYQSSHYRSLSGHSNPHPPQLPSLPSLATGPQAIQPPAHVAPPSFPSHPTSQPNSAGTGPLHAPLGASNPSSHSSHGHSSSGSMRELLTQDQQDLYSYVRTLESRLSRMQDEYELRIARLQADVIDLKAQVYQGR